MYVLKVFVLERVDLCILRGRWGGGGGELMSYIKLVIKLVIYVIIFIFL